MSILPDPPAVAFVDVADFGNDLAAVRFALLPTVEQQRYREAAAQLLDDHIVWENPSLDLRGEGLS